MAKSESRIGTGPQEEPELPSSAPRTVADFVKVLDEESSVTRTRIISILCAAVYEHDESAHPTALKAQLLGACHSRAEFLSAMLNTPFVDDRYPVEWAIYNLPAALVCDPELTALPAVLAILAESESSGLTSAPSPSAEEFVWSIQRACAERNANALFQMFNPSRMPRYLTARPYKVTTAQDSSVAAFSIPNFVERMLVNGIVDLKFVLSGQIFLLSFVRSTPHWEMTMRVVKGEREELGPSDLDHYSTEYSDTVTVMDLDGLAVGEQGSGADASYMRIDKFNFGRLSLNERADSPITKSCPFLRAANPYIGAYRSFCGRVTLRRDTW